MTTHGWTAGRVDARARGSYDFASKKWEEKGNILDFENKLLAGIHVYQ